jgi:hypothetical protein
VYNSRPHLYYPQNYYLGRFLVSFIRMCVPGRTKVPMRPQNHRTRKHGVVILTLVLCFFVLPSLPLCYGLFRNYQWEMSQPPTTIVPDLVGLDVKAGSERARSAHLDTEVLGATWYTDLSPGLITLQSPEAGQRVPFETVVGVEVARTPPAVLVPNSGNSK